MLSFVEFGRLADGGIYWGKPPADAELAKPPAGSAAAEIEDAIASNKVVVFSSQTCPFCAKAIAALEAAGYVPSVVDCDATQRQALASKCGTGKVPQVFVRGNHIGGCNNGGMGGVLPLLENGKIKELMETSK